MIKEFEDLLSRHFLEQRHPEFYASVLNCSVYLLNAATRSHYGKSVYEIIQDRVHQQALLLLANQQLKLKDIAYQIGCCDAAYFSRCFKQRTGYGPREYRKHLPFLNSSRRRSLRES